MKLQESWDVSPRRFLASMSCVIDYREMIVTVICLHEALYHSVKARLRSARTDVIEELAGATAGKINNFGVVAERIAENVFQPLNLVFLLVRIEWLVELCCRQVCTDRSVGANLIYYRGAPSGK
jgi:hypothetical protein